MEILTIVGKSLGRDVVGAAGKNSPDMPLLGEGEARTDLDGNGLWLVFGEPVPPVGEPYHLALGHLQARMLVNVHVLLVVFQGIPQLADGCAVEFAS